MVAFANVLLFLLQREFLDECVFNEIIEQSHYNTYSSARYSNSRRTMYLALNRRGQPRKVLIRAHQQLGKLSTYTRVLTQPVSAERVDELMSRLAQAHAHAHSNGSGGAAHPLRHHGTTAGGHLCAGVVQQRTAHSPAEPLALDRLRCRRRKKRKKKRRKCHAPHDDEPPCQERPHKPRQQHASAKAATTTAPPAATVADDAAACDASKEGQCQRTHNNNDRLVTKKNGKKTRVGDKQFRVMKKRNKKTGKTGKKGLHKARGTSTTERQQLLLSMVTSEEDYSSRATSSVATESEEGSAVGAVSWEEPFVPPYPTSTAPPQ